MIGKVIDFLIVNAPYIVPGVLVAALVLSETVRAAAAFVLRFIARPLLLLAVVALVYDGTRTLAGGSGIVITSLGDHWQSFHPGGLEMLRGLSRRVHPVFWDQGVVRLLRLPSWLVIGVLGLLLAYIGRKRHKVNVYINN
jgi:hypothetical protein